MTDATRREFGAFLDDVVHELRTPLTSITGYAALLAEEQASLDPLLRGAVSVIETQSARLGAQLGTLLEIARIWSGRQAAHRRRLDLAAQGRSLARRHTVEVDAPSAVWVLGDRALINRAGSILLDNARIHGAPPVRVDAGRDASGAWLAVADHGAGLPPRFAPLVGRRPFRGGDDEPQRAGTGFGLVLAAAIAELHGGSLRYERGESQTRFIVSLASATS
jgi:signal transduction histidine kinase